MDFSTGWTSVAVFDFTDNDPALPNVLTQALLRPSLYVAGSQVYVSIEAFAPAEG